MWDGVAPWLAGGGGAAFVWAVITLVKIAVAAERRRADDWHEAANTREAANLVMAGNVEKLIASVEQLATSQREILALVQSLATEHRGAA